MKFISKALLAAAGIAATAFSPAFATEGGLTATPPGAFIGSSAGVPPPGIYMFNQVFTVQTNVTGPGIAGAPGNGHIGVQAAVDAQGFLFVPGWTFLGATYDAVIVVPWVMDSVGSPINTQASGMFNTYIVPVELSWQLGASGFAVRPASVFTWRTELQRVSMASATSPTHTIRSSPNWSSRIWRMDGT